MLSFSAWLHEGFLMIILSLNHFLDSVISMDHSFIITLMLVFKLVLLSVKHSRKHDLIVIFYRYTLKLKMYIFKEKMKKTHF